jgi:hypothetical protein
MARQRMLSAGLERTRTAAHASSPSTAHLGSFQLAGLGARLCRRRRERGGLLGQDLALGGAGKGAAAGVRVLHLQAARARESAREPAATSRAAPQVLLA